MSDARNDDPIVPGMNLARRGEAARMSKCVDCVSEKRCMRERTCVTPDLDPRLTPWSEE